MTFRGARKPEVLSRGYGMPVIRSEKGSTSSRCVEVTVPCRKPEPFGSIAW